MPSRPTAEVVRTRSPSFRNARLARYPYMLVVGAKEAETGAVGVRSRDKGELGAMPLDTFADLLLGESKPPRA